MFIVRLGALAGALGLLMSSVGYAHVGRAQAPERGVVRNHFGAVIKDERGARINYSLSELAAQERRAPAGTPTPGDAVHGAPSKTDSGYSASPFWSWATLGSGIGLSGILVANNGGHTEIYTGASADSYWVALRFDPQSGGFEEIFVSPNYRLTPDEAGIVRLALANVTGDSGNEIVVAVDNGRVEIYDQATKNLVSGFTAASAFLTGMGVGDVDNDGQPEIVVCSSAALYVYSPAGVLEWSGAVTNSYDLAVGQMDGDAALEIALSGGTVVDGVTHATDFSWPAGFGSELEVGDIDADGRQELLARQQGYVYAFDVELRLPKWSIYFMYGSAGISAANMDADPTLEVIAGDAQWGEVKIFDGASGALDGSIVNPEHGVTDVAAGDADGDGDLDLLWGAGYTSSGEDHLYVADWNDRAIMWENTHLDGPFLNPVVGDLDGDGRQELVTVSRSSDSGYNSGRIVVFDARSQRLRAISQGIVSGGSWVGTRDLRLRDVDGDAGLEILVAADDSYDGVLEAYDFDPVANTFTRTFINTVQVWNQTFNSVEAADIDKDGQMEILGGAGGMLHVYNYATGDEEWQSLYLGGYSITGLEVADFDGDNSPEIAAMWSGGDIYVFDGPTKQLEAVLFGPFTALRKGQPIGGRPTLVAGNGSGELVTFAYTSTPNPYPYVEVGRQTVVAGPVDGFTIDARGVAWVGSAGRLNRVESGAGTWTSEYYGSPFGDHTAFLPGSKIFFGTTATTVTAFASGTGFGQTGPAVYQPETGVWFLRNANSPGPADAAFGFGPGGAGLVPLSGDWNGDGIETPGLYSPAAGVFFLKNSSGPGPADLVFGYGPVAGWTPVVGDWNGDGVDTIGLYEGTSGTFFLKNSNTAGPANVVFGFGAGGAGLAPLVGDWNGDGVDTVGVYSQASGFFFLRNSNAAGPADAVVGFGPSASGWTPLAGDWDGNGTDTIGLYAPQSGFYFLRNANAPGPADTVFGYGPSGATPLVGDWDGE